MRESRADFCRFCNPPIRPATCASKPGTLDVSLARSSLVRRSPRAGRNRPMAAVNSRTFSPKTRHSLRHRFGACLCFAKLRGQVGHFLGNALSAFREASYELLNVFTVEVGTHVRTIDLRANTLELAQIAIQGEDRPD